jgi:guanine nucleotide-binding protein G(i) subunit alpha
MGACGSSEAGGGEDLEQKKRSQAIDRKLEEDSRKLRRECKILLLGEQRVMMQDGTELICNSRFG